MRFLVIAKVYPTLVGKEADQGLRQALGPQFGKILASGRVQESGFLAGTRGAFFVLEIENSDELYTILGPEVYAHAEVQAYPVIPMQRGAEIFQQWTDEGR